MDDNDYQLSNFQLFTVVISNKYWVLKFCPLVLDATVCTGWNDKIVVLKKTTLQFYFKTFIEKKSIQVT